MKKTKVGWLNKKLILKYIIIVPTVACLISVSAMAKKDIIQSAQEIALTDELISAVPEQAEISKEELKDINKLNLLDSLKSTVSSGIKSALPDIRGAVKQGMYLFAVSALCGLAAVFLEKEQSFALSPSAVLAAAAILAPGVGQISSSISLCETAVNDMCVFAKILFPSVTAACSASGNPVSGTMLAAASLGITSVVMSILKSIFFPAIYIYCAAITVNSLAENELVKKSADFIKFALTESMKWLVFLYLGYSGISTAITISADASATKTAKLAISGAIPVIGGIVSDAAGVVLSGAALIKNAIGIIGIVSVAAICVLPFVRIGIRYITYKLCSALCSVVTTKPVINLIDGIGTAFGIATGILGTVALLLFISISLSVVMIRAV